MFRRHLNTSEHIPFIIQTKHYPDHKYDFNPISAEMGRKNDAENGARKRKKDKAKNRPAYTSRHVREVERRLEMAEHGQKPK